MLSAKAQAPELRLPVDEVHLDAEGRRRSRRSTSARRRRTRRPARSWTRSQTGSCAQYHADAPASYFDSIKFWKTPIADCGNGKTGLHGLHDVAAGLDGDQGLAARGRRSCSGGPPLAGGPAAASRRRFCRRPWLRGGCCCSRRRSAWFVLHLPRRARRRCSSRRSGRVDPFTGEIVHDWNLDNFQHDLRATPTYRHDRAADDRDRRGGDGHRRDPRVPVRVLRGAHRAARGCRRVLFVLVLLPLWSSYLVRVYAWRLILAKDGVLNWTLEQARARPRSTSRYSNWAMWIVFSLHLAAVHDPAGLGGARARARLATSRPRADLGAQRLDDVPPRRAAARAARASSPARSSRSR